MVADPAPEAREAEDFHYRFVQHIRTARQCVLRFIAKNGYLQWKVDFKEDGTGSTSLSVNDDKTAMELAVVMSRFLLPRQELYVPRAIEFLRTHTREDEQRSFLSQAAGRFEKMRTGPVDLHVGEKRLTAENIFARVSSKVLFADDTVAIKFLESINKEPLPAHAFWFAFYNYCLDAAGLLNWLEKGLRHYGMRLPESPRDMLCIFCKSSDGPFRTREHTIPASLGNDLSVLPRGYACDSCNAKFAGAEQEVLKMAPFAMLRIQVLPHTRDGKFPSAKFSNVHITKVLPFKIRIEGQGGSRWFKQEEQPDGQFSFSYTAIQQKMDHISLARVLVKAALGGMALEKGRDYVLQPKFDPARTFARTGKGLNNRLGIVKEFKPAPGIEMQWMEDEPRAACVFNIHGHVFLLGLTDTPIDTPPELLERAILFDLRDAGQTPPAGQT